MTETYQAIYQKLASKYNLKHVNVNLGEHRLELVKVENIDDLLDQVTDPDEIPFWAELWPASIGLATVILEKRHLFEGKTVLELGAGVGLAGIAARLAGAEVVQSDFISDAFDFITVNSLRNNVPANQYLLADWRRFPEQSGPFDRVIGADILYEKTLHSNLAAILTRVTRRGGFVWLADPGRAYAGQFCLRQADDGWRVQKNQVPVNYEEKPYTIDLYQLDHSGTEPGKDSL